MKYSQYIPCRIKIQSLMEQLHKEKHYARIPDIKSKCDKEETKEDQIVNVELISPQKQILDVAASVVRADIKEGVKRKRSTFARNTAKQTPLKKKRDSAHYSKL